MGKCALICLDHEGVDLVGRLAVPGGEGRHPALLVMHNAYGLGDHMIEVAERLSNEGYVALATDMLGGGAYDRSGALLGPLWADPALLRRRVAAWFDRLGTLPGVDPARRGALGYCFGGQCVLELARAGAEAKAVVSYHGVLTTHAPAPPGGVRAHVVVYTGTGDPWAPRADVDALRDELTAGGERWQITQFGQVLHGFTDPVPENREGIAYDLASDRVSWAGTLALLETLL